MSLVVLTTLVALVTIIFALAYQWVWRRRDRRGRTPTGFGALLAPIMLAAAYAGGGSQELLIALGAASIGSMIYWIDDARELDAWIRVVLASVAGLIMGAIYFLSVPFSPIVLIALLALAAFVHLCLTMTINMQDGADLNIALFMIMTGALLLIFSDGSTDWGIIATTIIAFSASFALFNRRPNSVYSGDSGCFAFASIFTILGAAFLVGQAPPPEAAIPAALPVIDMTVITLYRIRIRHKFTTRHYFHLYQRLQACRPGFSYLVPQVASVALALALSAALQAAGVERLAAVVVGATVAGLLVFLGGHRFFVSGEPGPPSRG